MTAHILLSLYLVAAALAVVSRADGAGPTIQTRTAQTIVAVWNCQDRLPVPRTRARSPWKPHSTGFRRAELARWQHRLTACRGILTERARQWNWQQWLPAKWFRIARCETGVNWHHANSQYISAFGISRQAYDQDADVYGAPHWDDTHHPSPWAQYQAARGHYYLHGGFSGWGCRGA